VLNCGSNHIEALPNNLFANMPKLKKVSFYDNLLEFVSPQVFQPILKNKPMCIELRKNKKIDAFYNPVEAGSVASVNELMKIIDTKCCKLSGDQPEDHQNVEDQQKFVQKLAGGFSEFWKTGRFSDVTITVGTKQFRVHKSVLAIQSAVFSEKFDLVNSQREVTQIKIEFFKEDAVENFLNYLYTGKFPGEKYAIEMFALAIVYDVLELKTFYKGKIQKKINQSNACDVFHLAHNYRLIELKEMAFEEILKMFPCSKLADGLMNKPENVKKLVEANRARKRKHQEIEDAFLSVWKNYNK
jgi:hypothetical protein